MQIIFIPWTIKLEKESTPGTKNGVRNVNLNFFNVHKINTTSIQFLNSHLIHAKSLK